jgi:hypothetical protein
MAVWLPVGDGFIEADVIRWIEPVFRNRRHGRPARVGERVVIAEVLREKDREGWVYLLVRSTDVVAARIGWNVSDVLLPVTGKETKRQLSTIIRGKPERLAWSDESARAIVASRFLGNRNPALSESGDACGNYALRSSRKPVSRMKKKRPGKTGRGSPRLHT